MRRDLGFTLPELMTTVAVLVITASVAVPAGRALQERVRMASATHQVTGALARARMEAIRRNAPVAVCPSGGTLRCTGDTVWDGGWLVYVDRERSGQPATAEDILDVFDAPGGGLRIRATAGRRQVRYTPDGWSAGNNVTLGICTRAGRDSRLLARVVVNNAGRVRTERRDGTPCPQAS